jgi:hypothetical protein
MFVNRIKICPDLHKLQLWFSRLRLRQCLFLKLLRQWTHKMGHFLSTIKHEHPICIWYTNSRVCISDTDRLLMFYLVLIYAVYELTVIVRVIVGNDVMKNIFNSSQSRYPPQPANGHSLGTRHWLEEEALGRGYCISLAWEWQNVRKQRFY